MGNASCSSLAILGVPFVNLTMGECIRNCERYIDEGGGFHQIATANSDFLVNARRDIHLRNILQGCDMVVADGMPLVWASRLMRAPLKERVSGADLVPQLAALAGRRGFGIFLLGTSDAATKGAADWMLRNHPGARIVGRYSPPYRSLQEMDHEAMLTRIEAADPDILLVAFGNPKQEKWLAMHRDRLRVPVCVGVGCSLDILAGKQKRAPRWMQRNGLEWSYRAVQDPRRLAARYAKNACGLARYLVPQLVATVAQNGRDALGLLSAENIGSATVLRISGSFTGSQVPRVERHIAGEASAGKHIILDFSHTRYLGPDALGSLLNIGARARHENRELWLTGLRRSQLRVVRCTQLGSEFRHASNLFEALVRFVPAESQQACEIGESRAVCPTSGRLFPLLTEQAADVRRQVLQLVERAPIRELVPSSTAGGLALE